MGTSHHAPIARPEEVAVNRADVATTLQQCCTKPHLPRASLHAQTGVPNIPRRNRQRGEKRDRWLQLDAAL